MKPIQATSHIAGSLLSSVTKQHLFIRTELSGISDISDTPETCQHGVILRVQGTVMQLVSIAGTQEEGFNLQTQIRALI